MSICTMTTHTIVSVRHEAVLWWAWFTYFLSANRSALTWARLSQMGVINRVSGQQTHTLNLEVKRETLTLDYFTKTLTLTPLQYNKHQTLHWCWAVLCNASQWIGIDISLYHINISMQSKPNQTKVKACITCSKPVQNLFEKWMKCHFNKNFT